MLDWLARLVVPLNRVLFHLGADAVSWAELLGFVTGAICVYLVVRANVHNFWTGILNSALFLLLFATARLWADASLQFIYIVLGFVGWWQWLHGGHHRAALKVGRASARMLLACIAFVAVGTLVLTPILRQAHDIAPLLDALTTSLSLAAQFLLNAKKIQNWLFWIAADVIYIPLYFTKHLNLTGLVYVAFLGLAIAGGIQWRRSESSTRESDAAVAATTATAPVPA
jgi:nicotinamide mononucleotide transporter